MQLRNKAQTTASQRDQTFLSPASRRRSASDLNDTKIRKGDFAESGDAEQETESFGERSEKQLLSECVGLLCWDFERGKVHLMLRKHSWLRVSIWREKKKKW